MRRGRRVGSWLGLVAVLGACECGEGVRKVGPELGLNDASIDFGLVAVGDSALQVLRLNALTSADIELTLTLDDNEEGAFSFPLAAPTLVPGSGFVDVRLAFTPPDAQVFAATLDIVTDDPDPSRGRRRVLLSGEGKRPQLSVTGGPVELSAIACGPTTTSDLCTDTGAVTLENVGLVPLTLGEVALVAKAGGALAPNLSLTKQVSRARLAPGEKLDVPLRWQPDDTQAQADENARYEALLRIPSNDTEQPVVDVPVSAHAFPNRAPEACIEVIGMTRNEYQPGTSQPQPVPVPVEEWELEEAPGVLQVRPGYRVTLSPGPAAGTQGACTFDPEGDSLMPVWNLSRPAKSTATMIPQAPVSSAFVVDAEGEYEVSMSVQDSLGQAAVARLAVNAIPLDDVFVQLSWDSAADLDLHLLTDGGPTIDVDEVAGSYAPASLFCLQDTFFQNPNPNLFDERLAIDDPRLLRDDQGSAGRLESISLVKAPPGSRFRVAVHYFAGTEPALPTLTLHLRGKAFGPFTVDAAEPLSQPGDAWVAADIAFPASGDPSPTVNPLHERLVEQIFSGVGVCP